MKEFLLSAPVPAGFFAYLGNFGEVEALPKIGEGFYKFEKPDWFSIKGLAGDTTVEVRFRKEVMHLTVDFLYLLFSSYREGPGGSLGAEAEGAGGRETGERTPVWA
ncbi:hypothetical protein Memar_0882 [Methanoculleus marisnigri JR1]|uniref:Uncharacterized protein n=2 Tax=Methanoculleus TaxID=45989 RepID=A3CTW5_METMJ|nr:hypothetical protein Memar_0882 [Methanoculleus marisnigri JR1]